MSASETLSTNSLVISVIYVLWYDGACGSHRTSPFPEDDWSNVDQK